MFTHAPYLKLVLNMFVVDVNHVLCIVEVRHDFAIDVLSTPGVVKVEQVFDGDCFLLTWGSVPVPPIHGPY